MKNKKEEIKNKIELFFAGFIMLFGMMCTISNCFDGDSDAEKNESENIVTTETELITESATETTTEIMTEATTETELDFTSALAVDAGEDIAKTAYDILKNQIGFSDLDYIERMGETSNYEISCDGIDMVITAMSDYYRVFIPSTGYVFYEDGEVIMTAEEYKDSRIDSSDRSVYYIMAQDAVSNSLTNPSSADFPPLYSGEVGFAKKGDIITVQSYVYATNALGGKVKNNWTVQFTVLDKSTYSYSLQYINIGGQESGEYTETN